MWLLGFIGLVVFGTPFLENVLRLYLSKELTRLTGEEVSIADLQIKWIARQIRLNGLQFQQLDGDPTIQVSTLSLDFHLPWYGKWIEKITVDHPSVWLRIDPQGIENFRFRQRGTGNTQLNQLPWDSIQIIDGSFTVQSEKIDLVIKDIDLFGEGKAHQLDAKGIQLSMQQRDVDIQDIHLRDFEVEHNRFYIPELDLNIESIPISGFIGSEDFVNIYGNLEASTDLSSVIPERLKERIELFGDATVTIKPGGSLSNPKIQGDIRTQNLVTNVKTKNGDWRRFEIGNIDSDWTWRKNYIVIQSLKIPYAAGEVDLSLQIYPQNNRFVANGMGTGLHFVEMARALSLSEAAWVDSLLDIELDIGGRLKPFEFRGNVDVMAASLLVAGQSIEAVDKPLLVIPKLALSGEMWLENQAFGLDAKEISLPNTEGTIRTQFSWKNGPYLELDYAFSKFDFSHLAPLGGAQLHGYGQIYGAIEGPTNDLKGGGYGRARRFSTAGFYFADAIQFQYELPDLKHLNFDLNDIKLGKSILNGRLDFDFNAPLSLNAHIETQDSHAQDLMKIFFDLPGLDSHASGMATINGPINNLAVKATLELDKADLWGEAFPVGHASVLYQNRQLTAEHVNFTRKSGEETVLFRGSLLSNGESNFEARLANISIGDLSVIQSQGLPIDGRLNGRIFINSRNGNISPSGTINLAKLRYQQERLSDAEIRFFEDGKQLQFRGGLSDNTLKLTGLSGYSTLEPYRFAINLNAFPMHIFYPRTIKGNTIFATLSGNMKIAGENEAYKLEGKIKRMEASWSDTKIGAMEPFQFSVSNDGFGVIGLTLQDNHDTNFSISARTFQQRPNVKINGVVNLPLLEDFVPGLTQAAGSAIVSINSSGRLRDAARGTVTIPDGYIAGTWFPHPLEDINAKIDISPSEIEFSKVTGRLGGGELNVQGKIATESFVPQGFDIQAELKAGQIKLISDLPPIYGDAQLNLKGPLEEPIMSGDVQILDMQFIERIDWEDWLLAFSSLNLDQNIDDENEQSYFRMDIGVKGDNSIRVRNNLGDLHASADLQMIGTLTRPGMRGVVQVEPDGRVLLKERDFNLLRGELRFVDPYTFDPEVDIAMTTTVRSLEQDIDIQYYVSGLYSNWVTQTTSNPPLPQADINSLLLLGMTRDQLERFGGLSSALIVEGGDLIASKFGVVERFNQVSEGIFQADILRFDRMDIISGASMAGSSAMNSSLRLLAEKDLSPSSTLSVEQSFNRAGDIYVSLEQRLAQRIVTEVFWGTEQKGRYLNIGGAYGAALRLRWEFE